MNAETAQYLERRKQVTTPWLGRSEQVQFWESREDDVMDNAEATKSSS
jgi:hypothetical protein